MPPLKGEGMDKMKRNVLVGSIAILLIAAAVIVTVILLSGGPSLRGNWEMHKFTVGSGETMVTTNSVDGDGNPVGAWVQQAFVFDRIDGVNVFMHFEGGLEDSDIQDEGAQWRRNGCTIEVYMPAVPESTEGAGDGSEELLIAKFTIVTHTSEALVITEVLLDASGEAETNQDAARTMHFTRNNDLFED